jgi:hypothetical protein
MEEIQCWSTFNGRKKELTDLYPEKEPTDLYPKLQVSIQRKNNWFVHLWKQNFFLFYTITSMFSGEFSILTQ